MLKMAYFALLESPILISLSDRKILKYPHCALISRKIHTVFRLLEPFPNLKANQVGICAQALQNVAALEIDPFGLLWALDSGTSAIYSRPNKKCAAKLIQIDLNENVPKFEIIHVFEEKIIGKDSMILHMVYDGQDKFYFTDILQKRIIGFDKMKKKCTIFASEDIFKPINTAIKLENGQEINLPFGVAGIALQVQWLKSKQSFSRNFSDSFQTHLRLTSDSYYTVLFHNLSVTQIFREIKVGKSRVLKSAS